MANEAPENGQLPELFETIETGIAPVNWCVVDRDDARPARFEPALMPLLVGTADRAVSWLDQLLHGGLRVPKRVSGGRGLTLVLTGPPGTGKSTFALELAFRWARREPPLTATYVSTETPASWLREKAIELWGDEARECVKTTTGPSEPCKLGIYHADRLFDIDAHFKHRDSTAKTDVMPRHSDSEAQESVAVSAPMAEKIAALLGLRYRTETSP